MPRKKPSATIVARPFMLAAKNSHILAPAGSPAFAEIMPTRPVEVATPERKFRLPSPAVQACLPILAFA
jgi:hypothetical protein